MKPKRPRARAVPVVLDLSKLSERCSYHGSLEHKDKRSWLGSLARGDGRATWPRSAPLTTDQERDTATEWVREAIRNGQFDPGCELRNGFPRYIGPRTVPTGTGF